MARVAGKAGWATWFLACAAQADNCQFVWRQIFPSTSPGIRVEWAAAYDSRRQTAVLFGGGNPLTGPLWAGDTWEWDGNNWTKRNLGAAPPARKAAAMAYDSDRGVCVLFGGGTNTLQGQIPFNDTWEYDGSTWTLRVANDPAATDRPPPMGGAMLAYDSSRKRMVLLGDSDQSGGQINPLANTWEWDGNNWFVQHTAPPPRGGSAMAYDPAQSVTVVFGGEPFTGGSLLNDTWTWNGANWTEAATGGPPGRIEHAMIFDVRRNVLVLVGGESAGGILALYNDTWEWNGVFWAQDIGADYYGLSPRREHKMWYDSGQQWAVVFGGTYSQRNPDGSFTHTITDDYFEGWPPGIWVDFSYAGSSDASFYAPFNTLAAAVAAAPAGCTINLKTGSSSEALTINKPLELKAYNGWVTLGH